MKSPLKPVVRSLAIAFGGFSAALSVMPAAAQQQMERVEITGSAIKRVDAETAVPVTVVTMDELKQAGVTTTEQVMSFLTSVQINTGTSQVVGSGSGGASFADMRGIGANKTLVLLNGRRVANNAYDSSAVDLNMIPFAAIQRVEVLRDGASSLYGTDAVGGVINFITRKDFAGAVVSAGADFPQENGGQAWNANIGFGYGDLAKDGFNIFGFFDIKKQDRITGTERPFNKRQPGGLSPTPFPANYYQDGEFVGNPAGPGCTNPSFLVQAGDDSSCYIATSEFVNYTPKTDRMSAMLRGSLALGANNTLSLEWFGTESKVQSLIAPVPYGSLWMNPKRADGSLNPWYPGNPGAITPTIPLNPTYTVSNMSPRPGVALQPGFIIVKWRDLAHGQRTDDTTNDQQRFVAQLEGAAAGWDYVVGASYNENKVKQDISGYSNGNLIASAMANGLLNPFGAQDATGDKVIAETGLAGNLQNAKGKVTSIDGKASREFGNWLGAGNAALAVGAEYRKEDFWSASNTPFAEKVVSSTGVDPYAVAEGDRNVFAVYGELAIPLLKGVDLTMAIRYDDYSDFGNTTNPKFTLRWQPMQSLLLRGTYGTGFRAPSLYEIYSSPYFTNTPQMDDPVNCPNGQPIPGKSKTLNCQVQFQAQYGGNTNLKPEESTNYTFGIVWEPVKNLSLGADFWWITLDNMIGSISPYTAADNYATFSSLFKRNASGDLSIDGFACPGSDCGYIDLRTQNLGGLKTNGVDLSASWRVATAGWGDFTLGLNSTYIQKYDYQDYTNGPWNKNVGVYVGSGPIFKWQHVGNVLWRMSNWSVGFVGRYKDSYVDQDPSNTVSSYFVADAYVGFSPVKDMSLTFGINNLFDKDPPYSNQQDTFQANYDPRFTDPTGRTFYLRGTWKFL